MQIAAEDLCGQFVHILEEDHLWMKCLHILQSLEYEHATRILCALEEIESWVLADSSRKGHFTEEYVKSFRSQAPEEMLTNIVLVE